MIRSRAPPIGTSVTVSTRDPCRAITYTTNMVISPATNAATVTDQVPIRSVPNPHNEAYLDAKRDKLGHALHHQGLPLDEQLLHEEHMKDSERDDAEGDGPRTERRTDYLPGD